MAATEWRGRLEVIATGDLSRIAGGASRTSAQREYILRKALEALAQVGTRESLDRVHKSRQN
jgi:hypothetical protein